MSKKILICDDDQAVLSMIQFKLTNEKLGEIFIARDGHQAIQHLQEQTFDLVITDIHMPYHDGGEVLNLIRNEQKKMTPVIMLSSDGQEEVIALAKRQGVNEFIKKPIKSANDVANSAKKLLQKKK